MLKFKRASEVDLSNFNPEKDLQEDFNRGPQGLIREFFLKHKQQLIATHEFTREDIIIDGYKYKDFLSELYNDAMKAPYKGTVRWIKEGYNLRRNSISGQTFKIFTITDEAIEWLKNFSSN